MTDARHHAHIEHDIMSRGIKVALTERTGSAIFTTMWGPRGQWVEQDGSAEPPRDSAGESPWLRLTDGEARALYEALAEHYGHTLHADTAALRADLDHEKARVDRFIDFHLRTTIIMQPPNGDPSV